MTRTEKIRESTAKAEMRKSMTGCERHCHKYNGNIYHFGTTGTALIWMSVEVTRAGQYGRPVTFWRDIDIYGKTAIAVARDWINNSWRPSSARRG